MDPIDEYQTDRRVEVSRNPKPSALYRVQSADTPFIVGGLLNIGGRSASLPPNATLGLGGGETDIIIRKYGDDRSSDGHLVAVGFTSDNPDAVL